MGSAKSTPEITAPLHTPRDLPRAEHTLCQDLLDKRRFSSVSLVSVCACGYFEFGRNASLLGLLVVERKISAADGLAACTELSSGGVDKRKGL